MHAVESLTHAVEAKDPYTFGHSERVAKYASAIAAELGLFEETQEAIRRGGALHDIGKIGVDEKILSKPGRLTEEEFAQIKLHPTIGVKILLPLRFPQEVIDGVQYHHERMDGSGYPEGRKGNEIPLSAKILAVCDAFEAMTSDRPYRKALLLQDAEQELRKSAGIWFDAKIVETFLNMVKEKKNFLEKRA
jgi:putative nucleotidyltransferase with HDIG domain